MEQTVDWGLMLILAALAVGALFLCIHLGKMAFAGAGRAVPQRPAGVARQVAAGVLAVLTLAALLFLALLMKMFWPHFVSLDGAERCVYRYRYVDEAENIREAAVELPPEDGEALAALIAGKPFRAAIDLHTGYTPAYSLEFYGADGVAARLLIQSFGNGRLRLDGTDWECDFEGEDGELLLSTLEKHRGGDRLLEAA